MPNYLKYEYLRSLNPFIHYFGLGFVQIKLNPEERVHFYTKKLPAIVSLEDVHNHRYDFTSYILKGVLYQELWNFDEIPSYAASHEMNPETCRESDTTKAHPTYYGSISKTLDSYLVAGSSYTLDSHQFHRVKATGDCVTLVRRIGFADGKTGYTNDYADVIRLKGSKPVCPFSLKIPEEELWKTVKEMLT
jgi:hypothetical protein